MFLCVGMSSWDGFLALKQLLILPSKKSMFRNEFYMFYVNMKWTNGRSEASCWIGISVTSFLPNLLLVFYAFRDLR